MRRTAAAALAIVVGLALTASSASAFTIKNVSMRSNGKRLTYSLIICTSKKATLTLVGTFSGRHVKTAKPGATQYQDKGCYPAAVSVAIVKKKQTSCIPAACAAVRGYLYKGRVVVKDVKTKKSSTSKQRQARA